MSEENFPFLKLPLVTRRKAVSKMDEISIIQLRHFFSEQTEGSGVKEFAPKIFHVRMYGPEAMVVFGNLDWTFLTRESTYFTIENIDEYEMKEARTIPRITKKNEKRWWYTYSTHPYADAMFLIKYLMQAFVKAKITELELTVSAHEVDDFFNEVDHKRVELLNAGCDIDINEDDIKLIMERGTKIKQFWIRSWIKNFEPNQRINIESQHICCGPWFTLNTLINIDAEHFSVHLPKLNNKDMNAFVTRWQNGEHAQLKKLLLFSNDEHNFCTDEIRDKIKYEEITDEAVAQFRRVKNRSPLGIHGCMIRSNSNKVATIWTEEKDENSYRTFIFLRSDY